MWRWRPANAQTAVFFCPPAVEANGDVYARNSPLIVSDVARLSELYPTSIRARRGQRALSMIRCVGRAEPKCTRTRTRSRERVTS